MYHTTTFLRFHSAYVGSPLQAIQPEPSPCFDTLDSGYVLLLRSRCLCCHSTLSLLTFYTSSTDLIRWHNKRFNYSVISGRYHSAVFCGCTIFSSTISLLTNDWYRYERVDVLTWVLESNLLNTDGHHCFTRDGGRRRQQVTFSYKKISHENFTKQHHTTVATLGKPSLKATWITFSFSFDWIYSELSKKFSKVQAI